MSQLTETLEEQSQLVFDGASSNVMWSSKLLTGTLKPLNWDKTDAKLPIMIEKQVYDMK